MRLESADDAMNRMINALRCSVASYLRFGRPWVGTSEAARVANTIWQMAVSHNEHVIRLGKFLIERHGYVESRTFPIAFARLNDLSIEFLLPVVIEDETQVISLGEAAGKALRSDHEAYGLVVEVVDSEKRHLKTLQRLSDCHYGIVTDASASPRRRTSAWPVANERPHDRILPPSRQLTPAARNSSENTMDEMRVLSSAGASPSME